MRSKIFPLLLIFCLTTVNCGLVSWFQEWNGTLNPSVLFSSRNKRALEHTFTPPTEENEDRKVTTPPNEGDDSTKNITLTTQTNEHTNQVTSTEESKYIEEIIPPTEGKEHREENIPSTEENELKKNNKPPNEGNDRKIETTTPSKEENSDECEPNNERDHVVSLLDIEEDSNGNKHAQIEKQHKKRCPRLGMAAPFGAENVGSSLKFSPTVGLVRRDITTDNKCEACRTSPICRLLKECKQCDNVCSTQSDDQIVGAINPVLLNRFAENPENDSKKQIMYSYANFSKGAEKEIICRILRIHNTTNIDTVHIYITTKTNEPPEVYNQNQTRNINQNPTLQRRFGEDYDYLDQPASSTAFISPSRSGKNPNIIEGPPPTIGDENPLIVEPEGLDDSDSNETSDDLKPPSTESADIKTVPRIGIPNAPALPTLEEMSKKQEKHLADINNAIREAKEMIQNIHNQAKASLPSPNVGSNKVADSVNPNTIRDMVPPQVVDNLKKVNHYLLNRAQDALDMIGEGKTDRENTGVLGSANNPENTSGPSRDEHSEMTKNVFKNLKKMPEFVLNRMKDATGNKEKLDNNEANADNENLGVGNTVTETTEIVTKPSKEIMKAKLQKYLSNLKKQKNFKLSNKKLEEAKKENNSSDSTPLTVGSRNNVEDDTEGTRVETTTPAVKSTLKVSSVLPNLEKERLQKERDLLKNKLKMYLEEQKNKAPIPQEKANEENSTDLKKATETQKDLLKERFNKFVNGLKSSPIKNDLKTLSNPHHEIAEQNNAENIEKPDIVGNGLTEKPIDNKNRFTELSSNLKEISDHTDQLREKLSKFMEKNNQNLAEQLGQMPQTIEDQKEPHSLNKNANTELDDDPKNSNTLGASPQPIDIKGPSNAQTLLDPHNSLLDQIQLKPKTDFLEKLREANEQITNALKPKNYELPKLPAAPKQLDILSPTSKLSNDLRRAKLREKLQEYVNGLKVPKVGSTEKSSADKYGKGLLTALKESEKKLNNIENNDADPKIELKNRFQNFVSNLKAEPPKILDGKHPSEDVTDSSNTDAVRLGSKGNFNDEETLVPWSNNLGKIVKSPQDELFFIGDGIKLPLHMTNKSDGTIDLSVDLDKLCSCNNSSCPKNPADIEHTVGVILEKEAELQKELNSNLSSSKKRKRSPKVDQFNDNISNTLGHAESKISQSDQIHAPKNKFKNQQRSEETSNDILKSTADNLKYKLEHDNEILKKLDRNIKENVYHILDKTFYKTNFNDPLKNTADDLKKTLDREDNFIHKFQNKLNKQQKDLKSKIDSTVDEAQESLLDPYRPLEKKLEDLDNEIKKENEKREGMLAEESKKWVGDEDINKAVKQETSILENLFKWYKSVAPANTGLFNVGL